MRQPVQPYFLIDAPAPLNEVLISILRLLGYDAGVYGGASEEQNSSAESDALRILIQYISLHDFESSQRRYFCYDAEDEGYGPLKHRSTFKHCGSESEEASVCEFLQSTLPIIYCLDFDFVEYQSNLDNDNIFFLDSSIWQRAVNLDGEDLLGDLKCIIGYMLKHASWRTTLVSLETLEYQTRQFKEMHLAPFDDEMTANHGSALNLSSWSSETLAHRGGLEVKCSKICHPVLPCRFLLIDDFCDRALRAAGDCSTAVSKKGVANAYNLKKENPTEGSKGARILQLVEGIFSGGAFDAEGNRQFEIEAVSTVDAALKAVQEKAYDIILLDYVLGVDRTASTKRRETGVDFLKKLSALMQVGGPDPQGGGVRTSVHDKLWVFPVSSFAQAFIGDMLNGEIPPVNRFFYWSCGADPVRQPERFTFELMKFMDQQAGRLFRFERRLVDYLESLTTIIQGAHGGDDGTVIQCALRKSGLLLAGSEGSVPSFQDAYAQIIEAAHIYLTSHQGEISSLYEKCKDEDSLLIRSFVGDLAVTRLITPSFRSTICYLESYLRSRRYYDSTAVVACMRDLQCIVNFSQRDRQSGEKCFLVNWARIEMANLSSRT